MKRYTILFLIVCLVLAMGSLFVLCLGLTMGWWSPLTIEQDDGVSGIGIVRGNTNGNLQNKGRAVCDGKYIYYVDQYAQPVSICQYDLDTRENKVLRVIEKVDWPRDVECLNLIGDSLYYVIGYYITGHSNYSYQVCVLSLKDGSVRILGEYKLVFYFLIAYDRMFITDDGNTIIRDLKTNTEQTIEDFCLCGIMNGELFGYRKHEDFCVSLDLNGNETNRYEGVISPIPICGYLVDLNNLNEDYYTHIGTIRIIDTITNEERTFIVPDIPCAGYFNVSKEHFFLQRYWDDECGEIFRMDWDGEKIEQVDDRVFGTGVSLWGDTLLADLVPCDEFLRIKAE
jgi:hypothetical protein